jgi:hypothetical protein
MARKNTWLPGHGDLGNDRSSDEPGYASDRTDAAYWGGASRTPIGDIVTAAALIVAGLVVGYWAFAIEGPLNLGAFLVVTIAILVFAAVAAWRLQRGIRRWRWRRRNVALTGGQYVRAWQRTPTSY